MVELIITEKPSAAKKIAEGLSSKSVQKKENGVTYYELQHEGKDILVASAVGHLYTVAEKEKSFKYPSYNLQWVPSFDVTKSAAYTKKYYNIIKKLAKKANSYTIACDYDVEGEVIGLNVLKYICKQEDAQRMKFSTLVKEDVRNSYSTKMNTIDWGQAKAGETRHFLDWLYGINISRALTLSVKAAGSFKILSSGRVQGPTLKMLADREKEIKAFKPTPYWQITLKGLKSSKEFEGLHEEDKFWEKEKAENTYNIVKNADKGVVKEVKERKYNQSPPKPFSLGSLQSEAYKLFKLDPKKTLQTAQNLYLRGLTSYPRTSSEQLPKDIGYLKILGGIAKNEEYSVMVDKLLAKGSLMPNNGKKSDPAHPAIYPTGLPAKNLSGDDKKIYDLIVKRFMATFGEPAVKESVTMKLDVEGELFNSKGTTLLEKGWHYYYEPYVKSNDQELPKMQKDDIINVKDIKLEDKETEPPKRYTPASLVSELEKRGLGTKATRADIIQSLYDRGYLDEKSIEVTELGITLVDTLQKYCPEILDEELTRHFEEEMENIREHKSSPSQVLKKAEETLDKVLEKFKKHEKEIGSIFLEAKKETDFHHNHLGTCPKCGEGNFMIRKGKFGQFAACDKYPDCKTTVSLPKGVMVKPTDKVSSSGYPIVQVIKKGKKPQEVSLNHKDNIPEGQEKLVEKLEKEGYKDPESGTEMKLVYGFYGPFLAAKNYPKEKKILSLDKVKG